MPPRGPKRDLSGKSRNPTAELQKAYSHLMSIQDPEELMRAAVGIVKPLVGTGLSEKNYQKFMTNLQQSAQRGLEGLQFFLSNYILSGSGMSVESRENAVASLLSEDVNEVRRLTTHERQLKAMVESYGYYVAIH